MYDIVLYFASQSDNGDASFLLSVGWLAVGSYWRCTYKSRPVAVLEVCSTKIMSLRRREGMGLQAT